jgi:hypothetical protein
MYSIMKLKLWTETDLKLLVQLYLPRGFLQPLPGRIFFLP